MRLLNYAGKWDKTFRQMLLRREPLSLCCEMFRLSRKIWIQKRRCKAQFLVGVDAMLVDSVDLGPLSDFPWAIIESTTCMILMS